MLFVYAISWEGRAAGPTPQERSAVTDTLAQIAASLLTPTFSVGLAPPSPDAATLRGYAPVAHRADALALIESLRQLGERFSDLTIAFSGWGELPPTQIRGGQFELFRERYGRALAYRQTVNRLSKSLSL